MFNNIFYGIKLGFMLLLGLAFLMLILFILLCVFFPDWVARNVFNKPDVKLEFDPGLWWWFKRWAWSKTQLNVFKKTKNFNTLVMRQSQIIDEKSDMVPWTYHDMPFNNIYTAKDIPYSERLWQRIILIKLIYRFEQMTDNSIKNTINNNAPQIPDNHNDLLKLCYPESYNELHLPPKLPHAISENLDDLIAALSLAGPFAEYISYNSSTGYYEIDLSSYWKYEVKEDLEYIGAKAILEYDTYHKKMKTKSITYKACKKYTDKNNIVCKYKNEEGIVETTIETVTPESGKEWDLAQKIMMATFQTDISLIHNTVYNHLIISGTFCAVNNSCLDKDHPLRRLMHVHQLGTIGMNILIGKFFISIGYSCAVYPAIYSYNLNTLKDIICPAIEKSFNIKSLDLIHNLESRNMHKDRFTDDYPQRDNALELHNIISDYVGNYIDEYYADDKAISDDKEIITWYEALHKYIPNGIYDYVNTSDKITKDDVKKLITLFIYVATVKDYQQTEITYNYLPWLQYIPITVRLDEKRMLIQEAQQVIDALFLTNIPLFSTIEDFSYFALNKTLDKNEKGKKCMQQFTKDMQEYQRKIDEELSAYEKDDDIRLYTLQPKNIELSIIQ